MKGLNSVKKGFPPHRIAVVGNLYLRMCFRGKVAEELFVLTREVIFQEGCIWLWKNVYYNVIIIGESRNVGRRSGCAIILCITMGTSLRRFFSHCRQAAIF